MLSELLFLWNLYSLNITGVYLSFKFLFICYHSYYAEIWKHSFISIVCTNIHTVRKVELFKRLFKPEEFESIGFCFHVEAKHFENLWI